MKTILTFCLATAAILLTTLSDANAQTYTLAFKQAKIVGSVNSTVPANHVWKVTSLYGIEDTCRELVCGGTYGPYSAKLFYSGFVVNGAEIYTYNDPPASVYYTTNNCTGSTGTGSTTLGQCQAAYPALLNDIPASAYLLPMWLPAGTQLRTLGSTTYASVIEFELVP